MKGSKKSFIFGFIIVVATLSSVILNSSVGCRVAVLMLLALCVIRGLREKYLLNPYFMFALTPLSLLVYVNISDRYMMDLTVNTWLLAIINMAAFLIAMDFTPGYTQVKKCVGAGEGRELTRNTVIMMGIGLLPTLYRMLTGQLLPLASVLTVFSTGGLLCAFRSKNKKLILAVVALFVISYWGYVDKTTVLSLCLGILIGFEKYYLTTRRQKITLTVLAGVGLLVMIAAFTFANQDRGSHTSAEYVDYYTRVGGVAWSGSNALMMPYMYLTTPWTNLQYVVETQNTYTYGLWTFKPVICYLQLDQLLHIDYSLQAYSSFNTFTFIAYQFKDFGFWGSILPSIFLGFFVKKVYSRFCLSRSPLDAACYVLVGQGVLEMFFSSEFFSLSFPFTIVIAMELYKAIMCQGNLPELEGRRVIRAVPRSRLPRRTPRLEGSGSLK